MINLLVQKKYSTYEWNIGYSPKTQYKIDASFSFGILTVCFDLNAGIIENAKIYGDFFAQGSIDNFEKALNGKKFVKDDLELAFLGVEKVIKGAFPQEIASKLLS